MGAICVRIVNDGNIYFDSNKADNESSLAIFFKNQLAVMSYFPVFAGSANLTISILNRVSSLTNNS
jgi:hypothetical protein